MDEAERGTLRLLRLREGTAAKTFHVVARNDAAGDGPVAMLRERLAARGARRGAARESGAKRSGAGAARGAANRRG